MRNITKLNLGEFAKSWHNPVDYKGDDHDQK